MQRPLQFEKATKAASLAAIAATAQQGDGLVDSKMRELKASIDSPRVRRVRRSIVEKRAGESAAGQGCVTNGRSSGDREDLMLVKDGDEGENEAEGGNGDDDVDIESTAKNLLAQLNGEGVRSVLLSASSSCSGLNELTRSC